MVCTALSGRVTERQPYCPGSFAACSFRCQSYCLNAQVLDGRTIIWLLGLVA